MKDKIIIGFVVVLAIGIAYAGWELKRHVNYSLSYESMVKQTVHDEYDERINKLEARIKVLENHE